eukprot:scaffold83090_cov48-Phaeocystis_antarctica.AAC.1
MMLHQIPAADPEPERLDETSVKAIQTKVNNKLDPAVPVRACRRAQRDALRVQQEEPRLRQPEANHPGLPPRRSMSTYRV